MEETFLAQKRFFDQQHTKSLDFRLSALRSLADAIRTNEDRIFVALKEDLNKSSFDSYVTEVGIVLEEIRFISSRLKKWMKATKVKTALTHLGTQGYRYPEPYGCTLIIAPWNYPFQLAVLPLVAAIAAGNCAIIKPSELTPQTSALLASLIDSAFSRDHVAVIEGGVEVSERLLALSFDYVFFTGSVGVGKIVMTAASKNLTPVTLELGGKSPCIIDERAHLKLAAKRIAWGKFLNAGQTCIAPDYVLVHRAVKEEFTQYLQEAIATLYGDSPLSNDAYTHIVSAKHFTRLVEFVDEGRVVFGGKSDASLLKIEPTILDNVDWDSKVMQDEIFGPILPLVSYDDLSEVFIHVKNAPNPLALYLFTENKIVEKDIIAQIPAGAVCVNDVVYQSATPYLPFGGRGTSGSGAYHGKASFDTFTHYKSVLKQTTLFDLPFRYPNFKNGLKWIKMLMK